MNHSVDLLKIFIQNNGTFVSGADLAEQFRITRVGIRKRIEGLQNQGFKFKAVRNRGYLLESVPAHLHGDLIHSFNELTQNPNKIHFRESVDSTNSEAERLLATGEEAPLFVISGEQTAGRGRRGRVWHSPPGNNVYLTAAFRPMLPIQRMQLITLWLGVSICSFLSNRFQISIKIKWPNDLIFEDRKIAGMLTEARLDSEMMRELIFGVGINLNGSCNQFPEPLKKIATTLEEAIKLPIPANEFVVDFISVIRNAYDKMLNMEITQELILIWNKYDYLKGKLINTDQGVGIAEGINEHGSLNVRRNDGSLFLLHAGDVSLGSNRTLSQNE